MTFIILMSDQYAGDVLSAAIAENRGRRFPNNPDTESFLSDLKRFSECIYTLLGLTTDVIYMHDSQYDCCSESQVLMNWFLKQCHLVKIDFAYVDDEDVLCWRSFHPDKPGGLLVRCSVHPSCRRSNQVILSRVTWCRLLSIASPHTAKHLSDNSVLSILVFHLAGWHIQYFSNLLLSKAKLIFCCMHLLMFIM